MRQKYPYNGAHGRLTYDIHDKHWIPHIGINNPSNCKADTKNKGYQEIMFFDWKIQLDKIQLIRELTDNTMIYQGIGLPCKNDQGYCDPTTRTQATIVWFPKDTCTTFQVAKIHANITTTNIIATLYSIARATTLTGYKFTATFSEKKVHCSQVSNGNINRLDHESFNQINIKRLLHLSPEDCKNELKRLNLTPNKSTNRKLVNFQVLQDSAHQAELEKHQGRIRLDTKFPFPGAHGRLTHNLYGKTWIPHIGISNPSNCKAELKNKGYQEIMFFDWKTQLEKYNLHAT